VDLPDWNLTIHGAAFTGVEQATGFLTGFTAPADGRIHFGLLHGELDPAEARYDPIRREEIAASGLNYLALGHIHKRGSPLTFGKTLCAWPGCPEGRGFDELGEKGFYEGVLDAAGAVSLTFVPFAGRRYEILEIDVTGKEPRAAIEAALPEDTARHLYRILLTGETGEGGVNAAALRETLADRFYALEVRDHTRVAEDIWSRAEEDSLRGLFLRDLQKKWKAAQTDEERETVTQAVRFGLAALDHRDLG
jgi:DNA repair exonuclease SbcCD nuclease subunit